MSEEKPKRKELISIDTQLRWALHGIHIAMALLFICPLLMMIFGLLVNQQ